jgi:hypothetical protein
MYLSIGCGSVERRGSPPAVTTTREPTTERATIPPPPVAKRPDAHAARVGPYVFHTDFPLDTRDPLFRELETLPDQIESELRVATGSALIRVFLYEHEEQYHAFLKAKDPKLPLRSAYFFAEPTRGFGQPPDLHVYTWAGPRVKTDLRHELTHALLHGVLKGVPLWLDEGLAGFFEQPPANDGVNPAHLESLLTPDQLRGPFRGDLARLEKMSTVNQMGRPEYQEAWAWVHFMLRDPKARPVLLDYIQALRTTSNPGPFHPRLEAAIGDPSGPLTAYLAKLDLPAPISRIQQTEGR